MLAGLLLGALSSLCLAGLDHRRTLGLASEAGATELSSALSATAAPTAESAERELEPMPETTLAGPDGRANGVKQEARGAVSEQKLSDARVRWTLLAHDMVKSTGGIGITFLSLYFRKVLGQQPLFGRVVDGTPTPHGAERALADAVFRPETTRGPTYHQKKCFAKTCGFGNSSI